MYKIFYFFVLNLILLSCQAQESYKNLAAEIDASIPQQLFASREQFLKIGKDLSTFLPTQHTKTGNVDYTNELQKGLDKGGILILPDFPLLVNQRGLIIRSNTTLVFRKNSKLIMKANSETHYTVLDIRNVENVKVYFANIEGDRNKHLISKGEWGMGIRIQGSQNINVYAPTISNCWGDGIYIGSVGEIQSKNISINNFKIYRARRNGISIISVDNLLIEKGVISETSGTAPQSALDIEPNRVSNILKGIVIRNLTTHGSRGDGIMISLSNLTLKDQKKNGQSRKVQISIDNHIDIGSLYAVRINGRAGGAAGNKFNKSLKLDGEIVFNNPQWIRSNEDLPVRYSPKKDRVLDYGFNPRVRFENISILGGNRKEMKTQKSSVRAILEESKKL